MINDYVFWKSVNARQTNGERYGQAVFNAAAEILPEEVSKLSGTDVDPFYNDSLVKSFLANLLN